MVWGVPGPGGYLVPGGVPGPGGVYLVRGGVPGPGGYLVRGVPAWGGLSLPDTPPVNRMTNRCKNITLAKTSFRPVIKEIQWRIQDFPGNANPKGRDTNLLFGQFSPKIV